jgi:protein-disulfide isomerase
MQKGTSKTKSSQKNSLWQVRAKYRVAKSAKQRRAQYQQQTSVLMLAVLVTVVVAAVLVLLNWRNAGATKTVSCVAYPQYCVPLMGGSPDQKALEAADTRALDEASQGAEGVVRYVSQDDVVTIGNPNAPVHFRVVSDFACSHCNDYHDSDLVRFIRDYVLAGKATFGVIMTTNTGQQYSVIASQAALCAGEQGAFWEMNDELYRLARSQGAQSFTISQMRQSANTMGLDADKLVNCISSSKYQLFLSNYQVMANDAGVTGTPTVLVSYGDSGDWSALADRSYNGLKLLTEQANASSSGQ